MKRYANSALIYSIFALVMGVFYREFTKYMSFIGDTSLSVVHTHYLAMGMLFFLLLLVIDKNFFFSNKNTKKILLTYHLGLNITGLLLILRGIMQVTEKELSSALNASISGSAGIGHTLLGISLILLLLQIKKSVIDKQ